jgi:gliding motility-associated-like protein
MRIILILTCLLSVCFAKAQSLYNKGTISIGATSVLFVNDSLVNNGLIINNGDMQIGGSWINNSQYDAGDGKITFNSDLPQVINHNDQSFSNLTISGGGEKFFQANITIENELHLENGVLASENDSKIILSENATITGGSDQAHIKGSVYQKGAGDKLFPIGNGTEYLPIELKNIEGATAEVGIHVVELNGASLLRNPSLDNISVDRYWQLDVVSGSLENSTVVLAVKNETIANDPEKVVVAESSGIDQPFRSLGNSSFEGSISNGKVTSTDHVTLLILAIGVSSDDHSIGVYNAVSPNNDGLNDFLRIRNIEKFPSNKVSLFNRWGDKIFELSGYDNDQRVFRGKTNIGGEKDVFPGTYFYVIELGDGSPSVNGYLSLKN